MAKYILENAGNINWMAISALVTFVTVFLVGSLVVLRRDAGFIEKMSHMPLEDNHSSSSETDAYHEK